MTHIISFRKVFSFCCLAGSITVFSCGDKIEEKATVEEVGAKSDDKQQLPDGLSKEQAGKVVAKVGEKEITVGDVTQQINRLSPYVRRRWSAPEKRKEFLEKIVYDSDFLNQFKDEHFCQEIDNLDFFEEVEKWS